MLSSPRWDNRPRAGSRRLGCRAAPHHRSTPRLGRVIEAAYTEQKRPCSDTSVSAWHCCSASSETSKPLIPVWHARDQPPLLCRRPHMGGHVPRRSRGGPQPSGGRSRPSHRKRNQEEQTWQQAARWARQLAPFDHEPRRGDPRREGPSRGLWPVMRRSRAP